MKNKVINLIAALGLTQAICASPFEGRNLQDAILLQTQENEMLEEIHQCEEAILDCEDEIQRLRIEIPILQRKANIQKVVRILTRPLQFIPGLAAYSKN